MAIDEHAHRPVLLDEVVAALRPGGDQVLVDATFGRGGHTRALLARLGPRARVLALDRDPEAVAAAERLAAADPRLSVEHARFGELERVVAAHGLLGEVDGVLLDLGVSSPQLGEPRRGFGFAEGPLDMRMDPTCGTPAAAWLAAAGEAEIARVLRRYGEEPQARRIARAIVARRAERPITTTAELAELVARVAVPEPGRARRHPATRTFQALRIQVNAELEELEAALAALPALLAPGGRVAVISFHSLEDRMVKRFLRRCQRGEAPRRLPLRAAEQPPALVVVGRARRAGAAEVAANPRARSAVLRVAERPA